MTPSKRSTLQLDLKDLSAGAPPPFFGRIGIAVLSAAVLVSTVVSINSPFASPNEMEDAKKISSIDLSSIVGQSQTKSKQNVVNVSAELTNKTDTYRNISDTKEVLSANTFLHDLSEIKLAMLAPSISIHQSRNNTTRNVTPTWDRERDQTNVPATVTEEDNISILGDGPGFNEVDVALVSPTPHPIDDAIPSTTIEDKTNSHHGHEDTSAPEEVAEQEEIKWISEIVKKKDTLSQIFNRFGLSSKEAYLLVKHKQAKPLTRIRPGEEISVILADAEGGDTVPKLKHLQYKLDSLNILHIFKDDQGFNFEIEERTPETRYRSVKATIWSSLLGSAKDADIPTDIVYGLASIFGWQVDFAKDIQSGDQYSVIFEELYLDDKKIGSGQIVAAELITGNGLLRAIRHLDENNQVSYYAPDGDGIQGSFLRTPIKFATVTSKFSNSRYHPILKKWRAHKGVDYGAPMKTPILATGDGVVKFAGNKKGYGKTIILRHGDNYQTLYAHLNHFNENVRSGNRVKQGDIIGYVGKTGWTTGPHLHYEFRINGKHKNPLTVELPKSASIEKKYRNKFKQNAQRWVVALDDAGKIPLALKD